MVLPLELARLPATKSQIFEELARGRLSDQPAPLVYNLSYRPSLDGLRGVAILMVMAHHAGLARGGFLGVDVFFVLSGFLITSLLMQEWDRARAISLPNFYARRALRLLPALLVLLSVCLVAPRMVGLGHELPWKLALIVFFYSANWVSAFRLAPLYVLQPTWSLAIEEQFYLLWPPLLTLMLSLKLRRRWVVALLLLGIGQAVATRVLLWEAGGLDVAPRIYYGLDTRMDSLLSGCLVGLLAAWNRLPNGRLATPATRCGAGLGAATLMALTFTAPPPVSAAVFYLVEPLACISAAAVIMALVTSPPRLVASILEQPALVWIGRISYGLYLWHVPIFQGLLNVSRMSRFGVAGAPLTLLQFATVFGVATTSFYLVESPMLRLKERFRRLARAPH